jgi:acylphosphatase
MINEVEWARRRHALEQEAAELGLKVDGPSRWPGRVEVCLEGEPTNVERLLVLLERRGIAVARRSEQADGSYGHRVKQALTIDLGHPSNQSEYARRLWSADTPMEKWGGQLLKFTDPEEWCGHVEGPYPRTPRKGSLPVPLLDRAGQDIGQVTDLWVDDGALLAAGFIASDQIHQLLEAPHLECALPLESIKDDSYRSSFDPPRTPRYRMQSGWWIAAVRLSTATPTTWVRLDEGAPEADTAAPVATPEPAGVRWGDRVTPREGNQD